MIFTRLFAAVLAHGALTTLAHVIMIEPHPYNLDSPPLLQTWPLSADLPFPCQGRYQHAEQVTTVTAGKTQTVKFWGSAVHGGGACQFSVAYGDTPPENRDDWHVIYSILGGCPAEAAGNIETLEKDPHGRENGKQCGGDSGKECVKEYQIPIPKDMKNGPATFAWTWFNKIGNREMYMVCAPIIVTGGKDDSSFVDSLPAVFKANIPGECTTGASGNVIGFPEPGLFGKIYEDPSPNAQGSCPAANNLDFDRPDAGNSAVPPASSQTASPPTSSTPVVPSPEVPVSSVVSEPSTSIKSGFITQTQAPIESSQAPAASSTVSMPPIYTSTTLAEAPVDTGRPDWAVGMVPCSPTGALICLEPGFFGICNHGWAVSQALAAGQNCVDGRIEAASS